METEYAVTGVSPNGAVIERQRLADLLCVEAAGSFPHARDAHGAGLFLQNGSRFYVDCGFHPELATPECVTPAEVIRYVLAGERILADVAQRVATRFPGGTTVDLFRCNVDYSGTRSTWGCHESYLHRVEPIALADQLIPHLVTRVMYTGAGGFNSESPGLEFSLSPRVHHLVRPISGDSTSYRGIFHTKDESLSTAGYHRLHVLCGDSCCSELATWLKIGTTALVVALAESGYAPGAAVQLWSPIQAMNLVARDPECRVALTLAGGRQARALDIQRHYLTQAEGHLGDPFMPHWAEEVCQGWRAMLDRIETDLPSLATRLDWAIKQALYAQHAQRCGVRWTSLAQWTDALSVLERTQRSDGHDRPAAPPDLESLRSWNGWARGNARALAPRLRKRGLNAEAFHAFVALRQELFEIDTRFGQLGERGIFAALDGAGLLAHHARGVEAVDQAVTKPPAIGRAAIRGDVIRRADGKERYVCDWQQLWDPQGRRVLDLSDPFETTERWKDMDAGEQADMGSFEDMLGSLGDWIRPRERRRRETARGSDASR